MSDDQAYEENSGAFSKARSHIMLVIGLLAAAGIASWLESLDPEACRPTHEQSPRAVDLSPYRA